MNIGYKTIKMLQTVRAEKLDEKNGVIFSSFHVSFLSYGL